MTTLRFPSSKRATSRAAVSEVVRLVIITRLVGIAGIVALIALAALAGCAATQPLFPYGQAPVDAPGFWVGLWHGCIAPVMFFVSLVRDHIRIYAFPNAGWRYDLGFMIGVGGFSHGVWVGATSRTRGVRQGVIAAG